MDAKQVWRAALGELQISLSAANFETWLRDTELVDVDDSHFRIAVPNGFAKDWLETRYRSLISQTLARVVGYSVQVEFVMAPMPSTDGVAGTNGNGSGAGIGTGMGAGGNGLGQGVRLEPGRVGGGEGGAANLNARYTFANFIVGSANRLAHAASLSVAERPGHAYNPLFLYGGVGLGKTHLMHAIGNQVVAKFPRKKVVYATSEKFTNEFITSIQQGKVDDFRSRYRRIDLLLIDDIQFIADKERTQEEFFHTFNAIHDDGKQIVLSSDRPPKQIVTLEERLRSRFEWGLIADLTAPDLETRIAILRAKDGRHPDLDRPCPVGPLERHVQPEEAAGHSGAHRQSGVRLLRRAHGRAPGSETRQGYRRSPSDRHVPDARRNRRLAAADRCRAGRTGPFHRAPCLRQDHSRGIPERRAAPGDRSGARADLRRLRVWPSPKAWLGCNATATIWPAPG